MNARTLSRLSLVALTALLLVSAGSARTAANTVPVTHAGVDTRSIGPNDLKPSPCAGITLTRLVTSSGTFSGTSANELILAGATTTSTAAAVTTACSAAAATTTSGSRPAGTAPSVSAGPGTTPADSEHLRRRVHPVARLRAVPGVALRPPYRRVRTWHGRALLEFPWGPGGGKSRDFRPFESVLRWGREGFEPSTLGLNPAAAAPGRAADEQRVRLNCSVTAP
jgi:hypothetical protein